MRPCGCCMMDAQMSGQVHQWGTLKASGRCTCCGDSTLHCVSTWRLLSRWHSSPLMEPAAYAAHSTADKLGDR